MGKHETGSSLYVLILFDPVICIYIYIYIYRYNIYIHFTLYTFAFIFENEMKERDIQNFLIFWFLTNLLWTENETKSVKTIYN